MTELEQSFQKLKHALENDYATIPIAEYRALLAELKSLRLFKRLAIRAFEYPRDIEMSGFTDAEKRFLYEAMTGESEK